MSSNSTPTMIPTRFSGKSLRDFVVKIFPDTDSLQGSLGMTDEESKRFHSDYLKRMSECVNFKSVRSLTDAHETVDHEPGVRQTKPTFTPRMFRIWKSMLSPGSIERAALHALEYSTESRLQRWDEDGHTHWRVPLESSEDQDKNQAKIPDMSIEDQTTAICATHRAIAFSAAKRNNGAGGSVVCPSKFDN